MLCDMWLSSGNAGPPALGHFVLESLQGPWVGKRLRPNPHEKACADSLGVREMLMQRGILAFDKLCGYPHCVSLNIFLHIKK